MLGCNLHSKHCIVPQPIPMFVQPRFGAPRNPRWRYVIKVYHLNSKTNMNKAKSPCYLLKQCSCLVQEKKMWLPVNDVQAKIQREMFFVLSRAWDKEKKNRDETKNILLCLQHLIFKESAELRTSFRVSQTVIFIWILWLAESIIYSNKPLNTTISSYIYCKMVLLWHLIWQAWRERKLFLFPKQPP